MAPKRKRGNCQCADQGCPVHAGKSSCDNGCKTILIRVDMDDRTGTWFCSACAADAMESGLFRHVDDGYRVSDNWIG